MPLPLQSTSSPLLPEISPGNSSAASTVPGYNPGGYAGNDFRGLIAEQVGSAGGTNSTENPALGRLWSGSSQVQKQNWTWLFGASSPNALANDQPFSGDATNPALIQLLAAGEANTVEALRVGGTRSMTAEPPVDEGSDEADEPSARNASDLPAGISVAVLVVPIGVPSPLPGSFTGSLTGNVQDATQVNEPPKESSTVSDSSGTELASSQLKLTADAPRSSTIQKLFETGPVVPQETSPEASDTPPADAMLGTAPFTTLGATTDAADLDVDRGTNPLALAGALRRHPSVDHPSEKAVELGHTPGQFNTEDKVEGRAEPQSEAFSLRIASATGNSPTEGLTPALQEKSEGLGAAQAKSEESVLRPRTVIPGLEAGTSDSDASLSSGGRNTDPGGRDSSQPGARNAGEKITVEGGRDPSSDGKNEQGGFRDDLKLMARSNPEFHHSAINSSMNGPTEGGHSGAHPGEPPSGELPSATPWEARVWDSVRFDTGPVRPLVPMKEIDLRLPIDNHMVDVQLRERAGLLDVSVRTGDAGLAREMQAGLGELVRTLESHGYDASPKGIDDGGVRVIETAQSTRQENNAQDSPSRDGSRDGSPGGDQTSGQGRQQGRRNRQGNAPENSFFETLPVEAFSFQETSLQGATSL